MFHRHVDDAEFEMRLQAEKYPQVTADAHHKYLVIGDVTYIARLARDPEPDDTPPPDHKGTPAFAVTALAVVLLGGAQADEARSSVAVWLMIAAFIALALGVLYADRKTDRDWRARLHYTSSDDERRER